MSTKTTTVPYALLRKAAQCETVKSEILDLVPDLFDADGWALDVTDVNVQAAIRQMSEGIGAPPPIVGKQDTRLIEPMLKRGFGEENGHGLYFHFRGGDVSWYARRTKKEKAALIVPVKTGSEAETLLIEQGYTKL